MVLVACVGKGCGCSGLISVGVPHTVMITVWRNVGCVKGRRAMWGCVGGWIGFVPPSWYGDGNLGAPDSAT